VTRDNRGDDATTQYPVSLSLTLHDVFGVSFRLRLTRNDGLFGDAYHTSQWDENANTHKRRSEHPNGVHCHYVGDVGNTEALVFSSVAVSLCRGLEGKVDLGGEVLVLSVLPEKDDLGSWVMKSESAEHGGKLEDGRRNKREQLRVVVARRDVMTDENGHGHSSALPPLPVTRVGGGTYETETPGGDGTLLDDTPLHSTSAAKPTKRRSTLATSGAPPKTIRVRLMVFNDASRCADFAVGGVAANANVDAVEAHTLHLLNMVELGVRQRGRRREVSRGFGRPGELVRR
jgi:hypothetical protein